MSGREVSDEELFARLPTASRVVTRPPQRAVPPPPWCTPTNAVSRDGSVQAAKRGSPAKRLRPPSCPTPLSAVQLRGVDRLGARPNAREEATSRTAQGHLGKDERSAKASNYGILAHKRAEDAAASSGPALPLVSQSLRIGGSRSCDNMAEKRSLRLSTPIPKSRMHVCEDELEDVGCERSGDRHNAKPRKEGDGSMLSSRPRKGSMKDAIELGLHPEMSEQQVCAKAGYEAPPTRELVSEQFSDLPWRIGRSTSESRTLNGVPRLSELCLHAAKRMAANGRLGDLDCLPDEILIRLLAGVSTDILIDLEARYPERIVVLDACWARISEEAALPAGFTRWRTHVEHAMAEKQMRQDEAGARLRKRYKAEEVSMQSRAVSATELVLGPSPGRRRHRGATGGSNNGQPMTPLERLRMRVRRERSVGGARKNSSVYGR